jgi:hypothetical protein
LSEQTLPITIHTTEPIKSVQSSPEFRKRCGHREERLRFRTVSKTGQARPVQNESGPNNSVKVLLPAAARRPLTDDVRTSSGTLIGPSGASFFNGQRYGNTVSGSVIGPSGASFYNGQRIGNTTSGTIIGPSGASFYNSQRIGNSTFGTLITPSGPVFINTFGQ